MTLTPGIKLVVHSFNASSALTPAFVANRRAWPRNEILHTPITVPLANRRSRAASLFPSTPGFGWNQGFFTAGALVAGSMVLNDAADLHVHHIPRPRHQRVPLCREPPA